MNFIKSIGSFFTTQRFFIYGILLSIPALLFIFRMVNSDVLVKDFGVQMMISLYIGIALIILSILIWIKNRKNINKKYFFWLISSVIIISVLFLSGLLKFPTVCDGTYDVHGDSFSGPVYISTICVSHAFPWNISFWPKVIGGTSPEWVGFNLLSVFLEEGIMDLVK